MELVDKHIVLTKEDRRYYTDDIVVLNANKLNHQKRLYKEFNLRPEKQDKVTVEFILQNSKYIRYAIKELDIFLKIDGIFEVIIVNSKSHSRYFRSREQVKYEFSIATNGRYSLISSESKNGILILKYTKESPTLLKNDSVNKWSFGIVSNGEKNKWVLELIKSIEKQNIPDYEILICGPSPYNNKIPHHNNFVHILEDVITEDIRAPICHKKNAIIKAARYNNLCIMHDRYLLPTNWFENFKKYGNYFDVLCLKNLTDKGERFGVDWMKFYYPLTDRFKINRTLAYNEWHEEAIIPGGIILIKKNLIESFMLDERLHWDELEDMQLSKIAYLNGLLINVDSNNYFISRQVRHIPQQDSWYHLRVKSKYSWLRSLLANFLRFRRITKMYYKQEIRDIEDEKN